MTPEQLRQKPNTVRLRSGVQVVNGITGETGPTFSEYVLLSDYEDLQRAHAAALEEIAMLNGALSKIAEYIEPHWKGAGLDLNGAWLLEEIAKRGDALEQAERRAERLKGHAEAMAARIEWYAEEGWVNGDIPEARAYRAEFKDGEK